MNPFKSFQARYRNWLVKHYELSSDGHKLKQLKNNYRGKRCFIIGNGPSLRADDLTRIFENGDITFAFNRIYHIFPKTPWRPTFYISQDEKMLTGSVAEVNAVEASVKFIPIGLKWYYDIHIKDATHFHCVNSIDECNPFFMEDIPHAVGNSRTVAYTAIQFAAYMGFSEIYLIGVDHHFSISVNAKGEIVKDPTVKDYFADDYNKDKENLYIPNTDISTYTFIAARRYADAHNLKIYNATRGGKLEVFERRNFDDLFSQSTNGNK